MAILETDIKLLESQRMTDTTDGGGRMTSSEVPDGVAGNIFPKVSRLDAVYGRVNLRKIYTAVQTSTLDTYAGAHGIITDPPNNENIGCLLFSTDSSFDTRSSARDRIESYVVAGPLSRLRLYGNQIEGQRAVTMYQGVGEPLPDVGSVFVLSVEGSGYTPAEQYCRITDLTHDVRTFSDLVGGQLLDYERRVITVTIDSQLRQTFYGAEVSRLSANTSPTVVRTTQVADAARYYGIMPLAESAVSGALTLRLSSVYAPLVPSTQRETAISLAEISGSQRYAAASTDHTGWFKVGTVAGGAGSTAVTFGSSRAIEPGSLQIECRTTVILQTGTDDGAGGLINGGITNYSVTITGGAADYNAGTVTVLLQWDNGASGTVWARYIPTASVAQPAHTHSIPITLANRGTVYAETLLPIPAPGTLLVDFRALGRWYRFRDNGAGVLEANDPSEGTGSIDYTTGACVVTLGAMPDVDGAILYAWGSPAHYAIRSGATSDAAATLEQELALTAAPVERGTLSLAYAAGGTARTATADANGAITGYGVTGTLDHASGKMRLLWTILPDQGTDISAAYDSNAGGGDATGQELIVDDQFQLPGTGPWRTASLTLHATTPRGNLAVPAYITAAGDLRTVASGLRGSLTAMGYTWLDASIGSCNLATGVVTITGGISMTAPIYVAMTWAGSTISAPVYARSQVLVEQDGTFATTGETDMFDPATGMTLALTTTTSDALLPGSVMFVLGGKTYVDRSGTLYSDIDPATGSGTPAGSIDYTEGRASINYWADGAAVGIAVAACLTQYGDWTATAMQWRAAGSPLRPSSLYVQATATDGELLTATADVNGVITGSGITGSVQQDAGIIDVDFGREIFPGTIRYNAVVITNLPLDAEILGLDPVRLPADGRVPIFRPADVVVIHHTDTDTLANPLAASTVYNLSRGALARAWVEDSAGAAIPADQYVLDLNAGTLTTSAALDLTGYTQPIQVRHRIEDMALLADVAINGQISLSAPTNHAYPLGSYVSGALLFGDMVARVTSLFDQATWSGTWSDERIGSDATATYDDLNYPVEVLNNGAVTERWRINFTGTTAFQLVGENLGVIATGDTNTDLSPVNALTSQPYFTLRAAGWGLGWAAGNQLRFNTIGANAPTWIARTILAGATLEGDSFDVEVRGDTD